MNNKFFHFCKTFTLSLLFSGLLLFIQATIAPAQTSTTGESDPHLTKAREAIQAKKYDRAEDEVKLTLKESPNSSDAKLLLARVFRYKAKYREAFQLVFEVLGSQPRSAEARTLLARLYYETEESGQAKKELDLAFKDGVNLAEAHALKAYLALDEDNYAVAIPALETALTLAPKNLSESIDWRLKLNFIQSNRDCRARNRVVAVSDPKPFYPIIVNYPKEAKKNKVEGAVNICALIDTQGQVRVYDIFTKLGYGTDEEAVRGLREIQFIPAAKDGRPIPYWTNVEFVFRLP